ncbi:Deoxyhypusine synthase [Linum perenne]
MLTTAVKFHVITDTSNTLSTFDHRIGMDFAKQTMTTATSFIFQSFYQRRVTVFKESESLEGKSHKIQGYDFNQGVNYPQLLKSMLSTGFQASNLGDAISVVNQMVWFEPSPLKLALPVFNLGGVVFWVGVDIRFRFFNFSNYKIALPVFWFGTFQT